MTQQHKTIIAVLNWKQYKVTKACLTSVFSSDLPSNTEMYLLDNESDPAQLNNIVQAFKNPLPDKEGVVAFCDRGRSEGLYPLPFTQNLGFAAAYNTFFDQVVPTLNDDDSIIILNNDTIVEKHFAQPLLQEVDPTTKTEMITATILDIKDHTSIDNLGVTMYRPGIAFSRSKPEHRLFCASGGCALFTVRLLKTVKEKTGHFFDSDFFCYTEDVDLGYRALLLGFKPAHAKDAIIYHHRTLSTGGPFNEFVLYYGMRNTLYSTTKNTPLSLLIQYSPFIILAHLAVIFRSLTQGKFHTTRKIYSDWLKALPSLLRKRHRIQQIKTLSTKELKTFITPQLFDPDYLKFCLQTLFNRKLIKKITPSENL